MLNVSFFVTAAALGVGLAMDAFSVSIADDVIAFSCEADAKQVETVVCLQSGKGDVE